MYVLNTTDISEWLDAIQSKHQLPLDIVSYRSKNFFSSVRAAGFQNIKGVGFADVSTSSYYGKYKSKSMKGDNEAFLVTYSSGMFCGMQNDKNISNSNFSFCIDLSKNFDGCFHNVGHTKGLNIPFGVLPSNVVDYLKNNALESSPIYYLINHVLKETNIDGEPEVLEQKIKTIIGLLSIADLNEKENLANNNRFSLYLDKITSRNHTVDLSMLTAALLVTKTDAKQIVNRKPASFSYMSSMANLGAKLAKLK